MIHCYKLGGYNIVLDVASGAIHSVDDIAYDAILMYECMDSEEVSRYISKKHAALTESDIAELLGDIEALKRQGKLYSPDRFEGIADSARAATVKALCLNVSHMCNMVCSYCFAGRDGYVGAGELMDVETGKKAIDFLLSSSGGHTNLDIDFFGGEPLLNWSAVKDIVKYARYKEQGSGKKFRFTLTTNGLLIDDDVIDFTNREMQSVVLSLDGREETNDANRRLRNEAGSYASVVPKIMKLVQARKGKDYYIRGTYTRKNRDFANDIFHIADLGFTELSMEPVVAHQGEPYCLAMDDLPGLCEQYEELAFEMLRRKKEGRAFSFYHFTLDLTCGPCVLKRLAGCGAGTEYLAVTPSGDIYPCHQFVGHEEFLMGNVYNGIMNSKLGEEFGNCSIYARAECADCWARFYCGGGCAANAYNASGSIGGIYALGCELFKKRIECAIMLNVAEKTEHRGV